jgi:hypothetical protein
MLALRRPGDKVVTQDHTIAEGGASRVRATSPFCVSVGHETIRSGRCKLKTMVYSTLDVAKYMLDQGQVLVSRIMHVQTDLLDGIGDVGPGESQVLESTGETKIR